MKSGLRAILLATVCAAAAAAGQAALAQTAQSTQATQAASPNVAVGEIVVTAEKREQRLLDVPAPVQAISAAAIQQSGAQKVSDLVSAIPSAAIVSSSTPGFETLEIRGIASGTTGDSLVGYYIDDTPFGIPNLQLTPPAGLLDLNRVEVIRGPSGTLYGQGSMGGTIRLVTQQPNSQSFSGAAQGEVSGTDGGQTNYDFEGMVNVPLVTDRLAARLSVGYDYLSGFAAAPELGQRYANPFDGLNARLTLAWTPTNDLTISGFAWAIRNHQLFSNSLTPQNSLTSLYVPTPFKEPAIVGTGGRQGFTDVDADIYSLTANWATPIGNVTANGSYIDHKLSFIDPLLTILVNQSTFRTFSSTGEVRMVAKPDSDFQYIVGVFYRNAVINSDIFYYEQIGLAGPKLGIINTLGDVNTSSYTAYGEVSYRFWSGRLVPLVGLSYFHDDRTATGVDRNTGLPQDEAAVYSSVNPRFNLQFKPEENGSIYINIAKGFRSGALQTEAQANAANVSLGLPAGTIGTEVQPDYLWTYELGTRWELANRSILAEASVYHTDWTNVLVQFATTAVISLANGGNAKIDGIDLGLHWRTPIDGLVLSGNGSYDNARFTKVLAGLAAGTAIRVGGPIPNTPRDTFTVSADYGRDLPWYGLRGTFYAGYSFRDHVYDATTPGLVSGNVEDLTLRAGVKKGNWTAELFAENALNSQQPIVLSTTVEQTLYPRRIGFQLSTKF